MNDTVGVVIERGVRDYQIFQQRANGTADIALSGRWGTDQKFERIEIRLVLEATGVAVTAALDWTPVAARPDGTWSGVLKNVPAGGLYRLETHLVQQGNVAQEWAQRGDLRHFLGVGDLWIIAGQSNSAGYGRGASYDPPELGIHVFNNAVRWAVATQPLNESTDTAHPANREVANSGHAPWLHWARLVRQATGLPIGLIQTSLGGSPLVSWNPTEPGEHPLYETMLQAVAAAGGAARGMLWYQGCSDASPTGAPTYAKRFIAAVRAWRKALRNPQFHVLTVQINRVYGASDENGNRSWTALREAQRQVPHRLGGVTVVPTLDLPLSDAIHLSPAGNMLLADRAAQAVLAEVYGKGVAYRAPEPAAAKRLDAGRTIELTFANVTSRMDCIDMLSVPFRVEDAGGVVPVEKMQYTGTARVKLLLARPLEGKAFVSGAYGTNPSVVPHDMVRFIPMLGFHRFPVA